MKSILVMVWNFRHSNVICLESSLFALNRVLSREFVSPSPCQKITNTLCNYSGTEISDLIVTPPEVLSPSSFGTSWPLCGIDSKYEYHHYDGDCKLVSLVIQKRAKLLSIFASRLYCLSITEEASPVKFNFGHLKYLIRLQALSLSTFQVKQHPIWRRKC